MRYVAVLTTVVAFLVISVSLLTIQTIGPDGVLKVARPKRHFIPVSRKPTFEKDCRGSTCTIEKSWQIGGTNKALFQLQMTMNLHTILWSGQDTVAGGSKVCLRSSSDGEVVGLGTRFYDSPPVVFNSDGTVVAHIRDLGLQEARIAFDRKLKSNPNTGHWTNAYKLGQAFVSGEKEFPNAISSWSDQWTVYLNDALTSQVQCISEGFVATCSIDPQLQEGVVKVELKRSVEPFTWNRITSEVQHRVIMTASTIVNIDPSAPVLKEDCSVLVTPLPQPTPIPTPSPTVEVTPTPPPLITTPPTISPTYTSPPPPTEGDSEGPPIFHLDN